VRRRAGALEKAGSLLSSAPDEVPHAVERLLGQLAQAQEKAQGLLKRALDGEARRLLAAPRPDGGPIVALYQGWTAGELRALAQQLVALAPSVALLGSAADKAHLVFAQTAGLPHDIPALLQDALRLIGGRGGGRGDLAQGGGERVEALPEALETAARRVRDRSPSG
jgi:alanyl-tRNA synthetase